MKTHFWSIAICLALAFSFSAGAQTYIFPTVQSPASCANTYTLNSRVRLDSIRITNIYFDNGTTGAFAFEAFATYLNIFTNSTLPPGNFFTYQITVFSDNPNLNSPFLTNDAPNVPLQTNLAGGLGSQNNPTYIGSASAMGLTLGQAYSSPAILSVFGYDSATLHINLPCLDTTLSTSGLPAQTAPLPVQWSGLAARVDRQLVSLSWQTFTEQNNLGFAIERSLDGLVWNAIGFIASKAPAGNSDQPLFYTYERNEPVTGRFYFRVIQKDIDGRSAISNVVSVLVTGREMKNDLLVYPNPSDGVIYLGQVRANSKYSINNSYGQVVAQGCYQNRIDVSGLGPGVYWIRVDNAVAKFMIKGR